MATPIGVQRREILVDKVIGNAKWNSYFLTIAIIGVVTSVFDGYDSAVFGVATPQLLKVFGATPKQVGVLASWGMIGMFVGAFAAGIVADVVGRKRALLWFTAVFCVFTGLCGFSRTFAVFAVFRFIAGLGLPALAPAGMGLMSEYCPTKQRFSTIPFVSLGIMVGQILVSLVGIMFVSKFGWRILFFTSFALLVVIIFQAALLPESMHKLIKAGKKNAIASALQKADPAFTPTPKDDYQITKAGSGKASILELFSPGFAGNTLALFGVLFMNYFMIYGLTIWLPKLMMQAGASYSLALWFNILFFLGPLGAIPLSSYLATKVDITKLLKCIYVLCAICIAFLWVKVSVYLTVVLLLVGGGCLQACHGLMGAYVPHNYPFPFRSTALGMIWTVGRIGSILSTYLLGLLMTVGVKIQFEFLMVAVPCILAIALLSLVKNYTKVGFPVQSKQMSPSA